MFNNDWEMLSELDDFMYKCNGYNSTMRNDLIEMINQYLNYWERT